LLALPLNAFAVESQLTLGVDKVHLHEVGTKGQTLNTESGFLPLIGLNLALPINAEWVLLSENKLSMGSLDYDGMLQNGSSYKSTTDTKFIDLKLGMQSPAISNLFSGNQSLVSMIGYHHWQRNIEGRSGATDLNEQYQWQSFSLGLLHSSYSSSYSLRADIYKTFNSSMDIEIPNIGDAHLSLPDGQGFRLMAKYQLNDDQSYPINIGMQYSYDITERSKSFPLKKDGNSIGFVTEPEHELQRIATYIEVSF
jgi:hypothetical protein